MRLLLPTLIAATALFSRATTAIPLTEEQEWNGSEGALRGRVESVTTFASKETGRPMTRAVISVEESLRGRLPARVEITYAGGSVAGTFEDSGNYPHLRPGEERLFFVSRKGGTLTLTNGGLSAKHVAVQNDGKLTFDEVLRMRRFQKLRQKEAAEVDLTPFAASQTAAGGVAAGAENGAGGTIDKTGLMVDSISNLPARWVAPDRGEPIPFIVDDTIRPAGVTREQGLTAITNALAAWTAATGMTFRFEGYQDFQTAADQVLQNDEKIRIQLHDTYGSIPAGGAIGLGGRASTSTDSALDMAGGGGGQVAGLEFHKVVRGYIMILHTAPQLSNIKTLEEVLCHELGHVFGLAHSSETFPESNATLREAMMYYRAHEDNRGATLGSYDPPKVQKAHPLTNTPPWGYARYMTVHTGASPQTAAGVNEYTLKGYDKQTAPASLTLVTGPSAGPSLGTFAFAGRKVTYTPASNWSDGGVGDPTSAYYSKVLYRFSDGVNCSPWQPVSVIAFRRDTQPNGSGVYGDGMPDSWMTQYFGNTSPTAGPNRGPNDDFDNDGLSNLEEYRLGTSPIRSQSRFDFNSVNNDTLKWLARPWALYELETSTDGVNWSFWRATVAAAAAGATSTQGVILSPTDPAQQRRYLRLKQVQ